MDVRVKLSDREEFTATVVDENTTDADPYYHTYQIRERNGRTSWVLQSQTRNA